MNYGTVVLITYTKIRFFKKKNNTIIRKIFPGKERQCLIL